MLRLGGGLNESTFLTNPNVPICISFPFFLHASTIVGRINEKYNKRKIKNKFKINIFFLYITLNSFNLFKHFYIKIKYFKNT